jgi:hypothetical protein
MMWRPLALWNISFTKYGTLLGSPATSTSPQITYEATSHTCQRGRFCPVVMSKLA